MERRAVNLSFQRSEEYESGAALLPQEKSEVRLGDLHGSLCARALWVRHLAHPDDTTAITAKPQYIFRDTQGIERHVKFVSKRLAEIFVAGRMMIPFLKRATMGEEANLPSDVTILSINRIAAFVLDDAEQSDVSNVKTRYWAPSRSVIHLAVVALIVAQEFKRKQAPLSFDDLLLRRDLIERIVQDGQDIESIMAADPKAPVRARPLLIGNDRPPQSPGVSRSGGRLGIHRSPWSWAGP